jgi:hypothetical protein
MFRQIREAFDRFCAMLNSLSQTGEEINTELRHRAGLPDPLPKPDLLSPENPATVDPTLAPTLAPARTPEAKRLPEKVTPMKGRKVQ